MKTNHFPAIDYSDLLEDLKSDLESGFLDKESQLYIVRREKAITLDCAEGEFKPVVDFYYTDPELRDKLSSMTVVDAKKLCFAAIDVIKEKETEHADDRLNAYKLSCSLISSDLADYTKGKSQRNDESCLVLLTKPSDETPMLPMMVYLQDEAVSDSVELIKVTTLLDELELCNEKNAD